jgi:phosphoketolase
MKTNITTLNLDLLRNPDADWRPANDLSVPQIYLCENLLQKTLLALAHINARLLGHWHTLPTPARSSATDSSSISKTSIHIEELLETRNWEWGKSK